MSWKQPDPGLGRRLVKAVAIAAGIIFGLSSAVSSVASRVAARGPTVFVEPAVSEVQAGDRFTVSVSIRDVVDLMAFQVTLDHDAATLRFLDLDIGPFLGSTGRNVRPVRVMTETASVTFGATSFPGAPGPSGGGVLALVAYRALAPGESPIAIRRTLLSDTSNTPITDTSRVDGLVVVSSSLPVWRLHLPYASLP